MTEFIPFAASALIWAGICDKDLLDCFCCTCHRLFLLLKLRALAAARSGIDCGCGVTVRHRHRPTAARPSMRGCRCQSVAQSRVNESSGRRFGRQTSTVRSEGRFSVPPMFEYGKWRAQTWACSGTPGRRESRSRAAADRGSQSASCSRSAKVSTTAPARRSCGPSIVRAHDLVAAREHARTGRSRGSSRRARRCRKPSSATKARMSRHSARLAARGAARSCATGGKGWSAPMTWLCRCGCDAPDSRPWFLRISTALHGRDCCRRCARRRCRRAGRRGTAPAAAAPCRAARRDGGRRRRSGADPRPRRTTRCGRRCTTPGCAETDCVKARISHGDVASATAFDRVGRDAQDLGGGLLLVAGTERAVAPRRFELGQARRLRGLPVGRLRGRRHLRAARKAALLAVDVGEVGDRPR